MQHDAPQVQLANCSRSTARLRGLGPRSAFLGAALGVVALSSTAYTAYSPDSLRVHIFEPGQRIEAEQVNENFAELASAISNVEDRMNALVPLGTIMPFAGGTVQTGFLPCDGRALSRTEYASLFASLGVAWGYGDGTTTFNIPDLRGRFVRGVDLNAGEDPEASDRLVSAPGGNDGDNVGSYQLPATALPASAPFVTGNESNTHTHTLNHNAQRQGGPNTFDSGSARGVNGTASISVGANSTGHTHNIASGGDVETRPVNVAVMWIIRVQ